MPARAAGVVSRPEGQLPDRPLYLFDRMDTLDKVHRPSLLPLTRAAIRILESTAGVSASQLRAEQRS